jgi:hypothetical protein
MDKAFKDRLLRAEEITKNVMVVEEDKIYAVKSQFRDGKAHIVSIEEKLQNKDIAVPNELLLEAAYLMDLERNNSSAQENERRKYDLLMALWNLADEELRNVYSCTCEDFKFSRLGYCKHILAVKIVRRENIEEVI